jgi:hypothetical protein
MTLALPKLYRSPMHRRLLIAAIVIAAASVVAGASKQHAVRPVAHPNGPTFNKEVVRVFQDHCQSCHHPGDIAPFSLMDYASAKPYATQIKVMTQTHQMPPWKPTPGCGDFAETRSISTNELDTIARWVDAGAPEGNRADLPTPIDFSSGWTLGQPDLVLSYPETFTPTASGDTYRCLPLPTNLTSDQYVSAIDIHPGDRKTVHHVIAFIDKSGASANLDAAEAGPGYTCFGGPGFNITDPGAATLGGWAPGQVASRLPEQVAFLLPKASNVVLQVHYHPHDGQPQPDKTEIGIYYAKKKPQQQLYVLPLINDQFTIPPGDANYKVSAPPNGPLFTPFGLHLWGIYPHMHLLGRKMNVAAHLPGGTDECLINIDDWDFNWQGLYQYASPIAIPGGSSLSVGAYYDNSTDNMRNPNYPPKAVSWGEQTTDEMCIAFIAFTVDGLTANSKADMRWVPNWQSAR